MSKSDFVNRESELEMLESKFESGQAELLGRVAKSSRVQ